MFGLKKKRKKSPAEPVTYTERIVKQSDDAVVSVINESVERSVWTKDFVQSHSFKGCKRYKLKHVDVDGVADTLALYRPEFAFKDCPITLERVDTFRGPELSGSKIKVYVDGHIIGFVPDYKPEEIVSLSDQPYDKAHVRVEEHYHDDGSVMGQNVYLFVRFVNAEQ